ncbi:MAG: ATP-binding cassette domain-containing protein [Clostridia bacterium]|nr:ATP-binding cassette domain-containing protein [Clostridia bacterium]
MRTKFETDKGVLALLGSSGCGKSMTLKCIAGFEKPDRGKIILNGKVLFDSDKHINLPPQKRMVGYLFQQYALFPNMNLEQNILCGVRDKKHRKDIVKQIISIMRLDGMEKRYPHQISGGQQQRVALARILVSKPELLLLDEPFSALDSHLRFELEQEVRDVIQRFGKNVILVSHNRDEVFHLCSDIVIMNNGMIEDIGEKHRVFFEPKSMESAILAGYKNISSVKKIDNEHVYSEKWDKILKINKCDYDINYICVKMNDIRIGNGENQIEFIIKDIIENPFSITAMLKPISDKDVGIFYLELGKDETLNDKLSVSIPKDAILPLR